MYKDLGTRFSEASVGAFNFMGLIGGMGTPDTDKVFGGVSYSAFGLSLTCAVYLIVSYLIWRARSARAALLAIFVALFGFFMFAPRMHERYLYYPLIFLIPIALESEFLTTIFADRERDVPVQPRLHKAPHRHLVIFPRPSERSADRGGVDQPGGVLCGDRVCAAAHSAAGIGGGNLI